jgi:hypothetical protein
MEIVRAKNDQKIQWPNAFLFLLHGSRRHAANSQGYRNPPPPPTHSFFRIVNLISTGDGARLRPPHYYLPLRIFRPSYGPNSDSEAGSYRGKHEKFLHQPANSTGV